MSATRDESSNIITKRRKNLERIMISLRPFNSDIISQYPYIDKVSIDEEKQVNFIYQYVKDCNIFSEHIKYFNNICTTKYLIGKPAVFPKYGNFSETFSMKTCGPKVSLSPWQDELQLPWNNIEDVNNYIYIEFHEAVYPIKVSIYEVYNPGYIIEIWAENPNYNWVLLWKESYHIVPLKSRIFSPPLQKCNFKTNKLKLKFQHDMWNCTIIDAVMLVGSSEFVPKNAEENLFLLRKIKCMLNEDHHEDDLTTDYKNTHLSSDDDIREKFLKHCTISKSDIKTDLQMHKEVSRCDLSALPDEIILKILKNLDLLMLCRMNQVNKRFNDLTRDPSLYTCLSLRYISNINMRVSDLFCYFTSRCKYLKQLDLTFCNYSVSEFIQFLDNCGKDLTHLRLTGCKTINDVILSKISTICKNLKALALTPRISILPNGFSYLQNLENLEYLNLSDTTLDVTDSKHLCKLLQRNRRMRELNLKCSWIFIDLDVVLTELRNSCQNLEIINLKAIRDFTSETIDILASCKNLRKVNLHVSNIITNDSLYKLFSSCQLLEEVQLSIVKFSHPDDLKILTCKNLIKLCFLNVGFVTHNKYSIIFEQCPKLQEFHTFRYINPHLIEKWKKQYPNVSVSGSCNCSQ